MFRFALRSAARRVPFPIRSRASLRSSSAVPQKYGQQLQHQTYSTASNSSASKGQQSTDDDLLKMDIDAAEKHMKAWFGDHASWSHDKLEKLLYVDESIPTRLLQVFGDYAALAMRPGGGRPSFPLLTTEEWELLNTPYSQWAPAPYNEMHYSCYDGIFPLMTMPNPKVLARLRPLKAKLLLGMAPISRDRWLERKMDDPANYRNLFELMKDIDRLFNWYNHEHVLNPTRERFNGMVEKYVEFEQAANLRREQNGIDERLDLAGMWAEFWNDTWSGMSNRTHQWIVDRVDEVQARAFSEYKDALEAAGSDEVAVGEAGKKYYECVQDLRGMLTRVDYTLGIPMTGFKGYTASSVAFTDLSIDQRRDLYIKMLSSKSFTHQAAILDAQDKAEAEVASKPPSLSERIDILGQLRKPAHPRFRDTKNLIGHYQEGKQNRDEVRLALRSTPKLPSEEYWITTLQGYMKFYLQHTQGKDHNVQKWGFVLYRLTYDQTDDEWGQFMEKLQKDINRSGQWIEGYDKITGRAGIDIIDGRNVGIAEGDVEAAKRHFKDTYTMPPTVGRMWTEDFLVVDKQSFASYAQPPPEEIRPPPPYGPGFGCNGGHVRLVDTQYGQIPQDLIDAESPGYKGEMKVLSSLLFEEIYPLLATLSVRPLGLWPCARLHPREVYVGTTDSSQEGWWEFNRIDQAMRMGFFEDLRKKKAALLAKKS